MVNTSNIVAIPKTCNISPKQIEKLTCDQEGDDMPAWAVFQSQRQGCSRIYSKHRQRCHMQNPSSAIIQDILDTLVVEKICLSRFGLISYMRAYPPREEAGDIFRKNDLRR